MNTKISDAASHELAYAVEKVLGNRDGKRDAELDDLLVMAMNELNSINHLAADAVPVEIPTGAIVNGAAFADRLERDYQFECQAGPLVNCSDYVEFRRCFDHLAQWASQLPALYTHPQPAALNEVGEIPALPKGRFVTDRHSGTSFVSYTAEQMQDYARAALAATGKQQVGEVRGIPGNVITHRRAWRKALEIARDAAEVSPPDINDHAYWEHEIRAFDRTFDRLWALIEQRDAGAGVE